jgi:hypothetical protein
LPENITLTLTKHFKDRWREYYREPPPSPVRVLRWLCQSIWLQAGRILYKEDGKEYKLLSTYWHTKRNMIIKVDWTTSEVVTVITPKTKHKGLCMLLKYKDKENERRN